MSVGIERYLHKMLKGTYIYTTILKVYTSHLGKIAQFYIGTSALHDIGWFKSARTKSSIDKDGKPIPWITYSCIYFLDKRINKDLEVFEYGSGNSTLWWAKRCKKIISCEHDIDWFNQMSKKLPKNSTIYYVPLKYNGDYSKFILKQKKKFHVIIIDGRDRVNCALNAVITLKSNGIIIWDNTYRKRYLSGCKKLQAMGFKRIDFYGMSPIDNRNSLTSIFYRKDNCLGI